MPNDMRSEVTVKRVRQTVLQFVPIRAEQSLEWMSHYQKTDAVIQEFRQLFRRVSRISLSGQRDRHCFGGL